MSELTNEQREAFRGLINDALATCPPDSELAMWPSEWVLCAAWLDVDGDTWTTRIKSSDKMPDYRVQGLLDFCTPSVFDAVISRDEDD